jgi:aldehyde dehydrogenase (NAD+)
MTLFPDTKLLINGELCAAEGGATYPDISPWTGTEIGRAADASLADLDKAIAAARSAFDDTDWSTDHAKRLTALRRYAEVIKVNRNRFAELARHEQGAAAGAVYGPACDAPLGMLDFTLGVAENFEWEKDLGVGEMFGFKSRRKLWKEAIGVVAAITPWNMPTQINLAKMFPALAAGCTVVLKPAPDTPMLAALLGELAVEAGLPAGVLGIITSSSNAEIGEALVKDPRVDTISFTGSTGGSWRMPLNGSPKYSLSSGANPRASSSMTSMLLRPPRAVRAACITRAKAALPSPAFSYRNPVMKRRSLASKLQ